MIYITAVRMSAGGNRHEHVTNLKWLQPSDEKTGTSTREAIIDWVETGGIAKVTDGKTEVSVKVVNAEPKYLRTLADGKWSDNLLALPRF